MPKAVTRQELGAWLLKCDPKRWSLEEFLSDGNTCIDDWTVANNYRSNMMQPGDPVVMWVSGSTKSSPTPGVWGIGTVESTLKVRELRDQEDGYWSENDRLARSPFFVFTRIPVNDLLVSRETLTNDATLASMEVISQPFAPNPSWLTVNQWKQLCTHVGHDPKAGEGRKRGPDDVDTPDPLTKRLIEIKAVEIVEGWLTENGWTWKSVEKDNVGWDISAEHGGEHAYIEVKGRGTLSPVALFSPNEYRAAQSQPGWELALITNALGERPELTWHSAAEVLRATAPAVYRSVLRQDMSE